MIRGTSWRYGGIHRPLEQLFRGVTTNPPLSGAVIKDNGHFWSELSSNIMIKIPGTEQVIGVIRYLTSEGIATNCTLAFVLPQFSAVAKAVKDGIATAKSRGVDLSRWRSVITSMTGRYEELGDFDREAEQMEREISEADKRWASIAIFKKAVVYLSLGGYARKMLICSMRPGPVVNGKKELFNTHPATVATAKAFSKATDETEDFVRTSVN